MFIGLGSNCAVAIELHKRGLLGSQNVFDNMLSMDLAPLVNLMRDSEGWFSRDNIRIEQDHKHWWVQCLRYGTFSVHDATLELDFDTAYQRICEKKKGQLGALCNTIRTYPKTLTILRTNHPWTRFDEVVYLYDTLVEMRPGLPFYLCVFQDSKCSDAALLASSRSFDYYPITLPRFNNESKNYENTEEFRMLVDMIANRPPTLYVPPNKDKWRSWL